MRIRVNLAANYAGQGWTALIQILFIPLYIHLLGIEAFALIGFFTMLQFWLALVDLGIMPTTTREMARFSSGQVPVESIRDLLRSFELICLGIGLSIMALLAGAAGYFGTVWFNAEQLAPETVSRAVALIGVVIALRLGEGLYRSCLIGLQRQVWLNVALATAATLRSGGAVLVLLWVDRSIEAFFLWQGLVSVAALALFRAKVHRLLPKPSRPPRFSPAALREVGRFASGMMAVGLLGLLLLQLDKMLVSYLLPLAAYGYYMLAATVAGGLYALIGPITQAVYPALVERVASGDREGEVRLFNQSSRLATAIVAPPALAVIVFSDNLLFAWSGSWTVAEAAASLTALLTLGTLLHCLTQMPFYLQLAHGWTSLSIKLNIICILLVLPALLLLIPRYGATAAAWAWVGVTAFYLIAIAPLTFRRLLPGSTIHWYVMDVAFPLAPPLALLALASLVPIDPAHRAVQGAFVALVAALALGGALLTVPSARERLRGTLAQYGLGKLRSNDRGA